MRRQVFKKSEVVQVRYEPGERDRLKTMAYAHGISISTLIRIASMNLEMPPQRLSPVDHAVLSEMARWGNNLNQVSRSIHMAQQQSFMDTKEASEVLKDMSEIAVAIKEIQRKVLS